MDKSLETSIKYWDKPHETNTLCRSKIVEYQPFPMAQRNPI